ncbi:ABC transporter substrate-binding protein [Aeromicrobium stalagmiti]|uniref:ABC transporter substrate-binding protein n=1 Tax=Aeromicrobium stalagmiti TaxID=2738988 RepID=UPI001569EEC4|nr:ABC transporter substrate-binding protein [Aeromicrobium stalagmiti]
MKRLLLLPVAGLLLAACGFSTSTDNASSDDGASEGGPWSYASGDGKTYTADSTPQRIIAQGEAAAALMSYGIKPVAIYSNDPVKTNKSLKGLDLSGIEILSETFGEIDGEKAAELRPDLIVSSYWPLEKAYGGFESGVKAEAKKVAKLAPVVGPAEGDSVVEKLEGYEELAVSLGADVSDPKIAASKKTFDEAVDRFETTVAGQKGLTTLAVSPADDLLYVAVPGEASELSDFQRWGLDIIDPDSPDPGFPYWENLSWENADKYQPDVILMDDRNAETSMKIAAGQPTWTSIKAAEADAIVMWPAYWIHTYSDYAEQLDLLSDALAKADPDLT